MGKYDIIVWCTKEENNELKYTKKRKPIYSIIIYNGSGISGLLRIYYCPLIKAEKAFIHPAKGEMKAFFDWKTGEN